MKQLLQHRKTGEVSVADVPAPRPRGGGVLVRTRASLISAGTEKAGIELARKSMAGMAKERPDLVGRVVDKLQRDGLAATVNAVRDQMDRSVPLGYSACGVVTDVGEGAGEYRVGDRVACAGAGYASHAEVNFVPRLLTVPVPEGVGDEAACYATVGSIALQGVRNADLRVGETAAVIGLGLIGQLTVQLLVASGVRVVGVDFSKPRAAEAMRFGADAVATDGDAAAMSAVMDVTRGRGVDAVLICAATKANGPVELAARIVRDRGDVVMVGVTGMDLPRAEYFQKECRFVVSRSYGPGRYDPQYEERGHDYPVGYVRWTEQRNLEAFLDLAAKGSIKPEALTSHRFEIDRAEDAYTMILGGETPHMGVVLTYPDRGEPEPKRIAMPASAEKRLATQGTGTRPVGVSFAGAGNFARGTLMRILSGFDNVAGRGVVTSSGSSARSAAERFGYAFCASSYEELLADEQTDLVFVCTRHSAHASQVAAALRAGKAVFVEKPLAVDAEQLAEVEEALKDNPRLTVGFNRRFAPLAAEMGKHFDHGPLSMQYRVSAGKLPAEHWLMAPGEGGRIVGEGCHFVDFAAYLCGSLPVEASAFRVGEDPDNVAANVRFADGSVCQLTYATDGSMKVPKERVEAHAGGRTAVLDDFRRLSLYAGGKVKHRGSRLKQDKGHAAELRAVVESVRTGKPMPIPTNSLLATTRATFAIREAALTGGVVPV